MATCSSQLKQVQLCYYLKHFFIRIAMLKDYGEVLSKKKTNPLLNNRQSLLKLKCGYLRSYLNIHVGGLTSLGLLTRPHAGRATPFQTAHDSNNANTVDVALS